MDYKIEVATINDVPDLFALQKKAFKPVAEKLGWDGIPQMSETMDQSIVAFANDKVLKLVCGNGKIIGSVRGSVTDGVLYVGRLMVDPDFQGQGLGRVLQRKLESMFEFGKESLHCYCGDEGAYQFYRRDGFVEVGTQLVGNGVMAFIMEKPVNKY